MEESLNSFNKNNCAKLSGDKKYNEAFRVLGPRSRPRPRILRSLLGELSRLQGQAKTVTFGNELFYKEIEQFEVAYGVNKLGYRPNLIRMTKFLKRGTRLKTVTICQKCKCAKEFGQNLRG